MCASATSERDRKLRNLPQRFRRHQPQALADLYDLYADLLYVLVKGIVRKSSVVDSLVQESLLRAWNRSTEFEETMPSMGSHLVRIARECAFDYVNSCNDRSGPRELPIPALPVAALRRDRPLPHSDAIQVSLGSLSQNEKRVVHLSFYKGLSPEGIADQLQQPIGKIEEWAQAGKSRLMEKLDRYLLDLIVE